MNPSKRTAILALTAALSLVGCNRAGHTPDNNPENSGNLPANTLAAPQPERTSEWSEPTKSTAPEQTASNESEFGPILATPGTQVGDSQRVAQAPAPQNKQVQSQPAQTQNKDAQENRGIFNRTGAGLQNGWNWTTATAAAIGAWFGYQGSVAYHAVRPNDKTVGRRDAMAVHHDRITETRSAEATELAALKEKIGQLPPDAARIEGILRANNETKRQLARVLTEQNPENVVGASERLVEDIFKSPDTADGKVLQIKLALRELAANDAYSEAASARVIALQTEIDKRIAADNASASMLRGGTIGLAMLAGGLFTGANGVNRTAATLHAIPFKKIAVDGEEVVESKGIKAWSATKGGLNKAVNGTKSAFNGSTAAVTGAVAKLRGSLIKLSPTEIISRDLTTIFAKTGAYTEAEAAALVKRLDLKKGTKSQISSLEAKTSEEVARDVNPELIATEAAVSPTAQASHQTRNPSIKVKLEQKLKRVPDVTEGQYRITFTKTEAIGKKSEFYYSAPFERQEAADLAELLAKDAPKREVVSAVRIGDELVEASEADAATLVEAKRIADATAIDGGEATLTNDGTVKLAGTRPVDSADTVDALKGEAVAANADFNQVVDNTKAGADALVTATTEKLNEGVDAAKAVSKKGWARTKQFGTDSKNQLKEEYKNFDLVKAGIGALLVGVPTYFIANRAYYQGHHHGEGYDTLYLEDLIPPNRLQKVIIKADGNSRAAE